MKLRYKECSWISRPTEVRGLIWIKRREIDGSVTVIFLQAWMSPGSDQLIPNKVIAGGRPKQVPAQRDPANVRHRPVVSTKSLLFREASGLTAFCRGFRQGFSRKIKPDRADLVDGGRIDPAQVARNI